MAEAAVLLQPSDEPPGMNCRLDWNERDVLAFLTRPGSSQLYRAEGDGSYWLSNRCDFTRSPSILEKGGQVHPFIAEKLYRRGLVDPKTGWITEAGQQAAGALAHV